MESPFTAAARERDAVFAEMSAATDRLLAEHGPSVRERLLLCLVADVCGQTFGPSFTAHVGAARDHGLTADDLRELLRFIAYDSGYPAALAALDRLAAVEHDLGLPGSTGRAHEVNADGAGSPIPKAARARVRALDAPFADYMDLQSRMRAGMSQLSVRERAFATITVDVLYQTLAESFSLHVTRALGAGATPDEVRGVVRYTARFGMTRAWRALHVLDGLLAERAVGV
ncbi:carboxymuconolactone decarboxylase family protein [Actinomadura atramentaria]|uniref:carboxymuconolactone decarboxylase family protein n=1 Tax=Actinomadura atramentaria TaxID=1990 RepID=UPI000367E889|nr:carboxymuconolactone decarboxylase family protein [Actinomadura atramentaria]